MNVKLFAITLSGIVLSIKRLVFRIFQINLIED